MVSGGCLAQFPSFLIERAISSGDMAQHVRDLRVNYTVCVVFFCFFQNIKWKNIKISQRFRSTVIDLIFFGGGNFFVEKSQSDDGSAESRSAGQCQMDATHCMNS